MNILKDQQFINYIYNNIDCFVIVLDKFFKIRESNKYFNESFPIKDTIFDLLWEDDVERGKEKLLDMLTTDSSNEFYLINNKNAIRLIQFNSHIYKADNSILILIGKDITEHRLNQQNEIIENQKFKSLFENPGVSNVIIDMDLFYLEVNKTFCEMVGYSRNELLKKTPYDIIYKDDKHTINEICQRLLQGEEYVQIEKRYKQKNGNLIWVLVTTTLERTQNNEPLYYITNIQNITDRKYYENHALENERKYRMLFTRSFNAIAYKKLIYDKHGNIQDYIILDVNSAFEKVTGLQRNDIVGRPMKIKAQKHFNVSISENMERIRRYDKILKDGVDIHFKSQKSKTFNDLIDVYYYVVSKQEHIIAVVFGEVDTQKIKI